MCKHILNCQTYISSPCCGITNPNTATEYYTTKLLN